MFCINTTPHSLDELRRTIQTHKFAEAENLLVQIFFGIFDEPYLTTFFAELRALLPNAVIIGASTAGEIIGAAIQERGMVASFAAFDHTKLLPFALEKCNASSGDALGDTLGAPSVKGAIIYAEASNGLCEEFLRALYKRAPITLAGSGAADLGTHQKPFLLYGDQLRTSGAVGVAFENPNLILTQEYRLCYKPIGKTLRVTNADGNRLSELDNRPIKEVINSYLGDFTVENLTRFPLLKLDHNRVVARLPLRAYDDACAFGGEFAEGEMVRFGMIDSEAICNTKTAWNLIENKEAEAVWVFSSHARKAFLGRTLETEFAALNTSLPQCGFFGCGEIFSGTAHSYLLNLSTVALSISEGAPHSKIVRCAAAANLIDRSPAKALARYVNALSEELETSNDRLVTLAAGGRTQLLDDLTGLPERSGFIEALARYGEPIIALININNFHDINSLYGYKTGDRLLRELSELLKTLLPCGCELFRIGGDVFVILNRRSSISDFRRTMESLQRQVAETVFLDCAFAAYTVNVTIAIAAGAWQILLRAETALNRARKHNLSVVVAAEDNDHHIAQNLFLANTIRQAILVSPIWVMPYFQPIARTFDNKIVKYEALMRLMDENGTVHTPESFLPLAKKSRLYPDLTRIMFQNALQIFARKDEEITLNLAAEDMQESKTMTYIYDLLLRFDNPKRVTLEITESEMIQDYGKVMECLLAFKQLGVKIAIDDFGSGYSNFAYLIQFQADYIKIDGSIVQAIEKNEKARHTLAAIVDFAKRLGIETIAEFISNKELAQKTKEIGVDFWQGYYIGKPAAM